MNNRRFFLPAIRFGQRFPIVEYTAWIHRGSLLLFFLFFIAFHSFSQNISVKASINKDKILIGEPIELQLEVNIPTGSTIKWFVTDTLPHFEFIEKGKIDSSQSGKYKQLLTITSFDSGRWSIPSLPLELNNKVYLTDSLPVSVVFSPFDPTKDYHDIKDIMEVKADKNYLNWILAAVGVLLLLALIFYLVKRNRRKKPATPTAVFSHLSPLDEALQALDALKKQSLPEKQFYTQMNDIFRWFVYRKHSIASMQKTNEELILQVEKLGIHHDDFIALAQTLRMSDVVKFAKYIPSEQDKERSFQVIRASVQLLNNQTNSVK